MRRALGLALVLLLMAIVQRAGAGEPPIGGVVALGLGFALIAAVLVAELTERVGLPRVTGYLLLGLVCGPYVANLITRDMARELGIVNGLAVALIAFVAGLEINLQRLRATWGELVKLSVTTLAIMYALLLPVLWAVWPWLGIAPDADGPARLALAILLTVVVISFSPTVTIAVLTENRARGPLSDLILTTVIFADLVLILSFTLAMQFAAWATGQAANHDVGIAVHLLWEIPGSLAFGAALGACFALYLRFLGRELTLVLLALCVLLSAAGAYLRFEPLLAALAAGLVVENIAPPRGDALRVAVEKGALPVLVLFFAAAGASLHLAALAQLGVVAVGISAFRIFSIRMATAAAGRVSGLRADHQGLVWMGLVSQAGVTLGLAVIVAKQYPGWGSALQTLVVSLIAIHEVIGPVLLRAALVRAGEIGRMDEPNREEPGASFQAAGPPLAQ
jgi:Kef-type K+ transport system membrane component KefB